MKMTPTQTIVVGMLSKWLWLENGYGFDLIDT